MNIKYLLLFASSILFTIILTSFNSSLTFTSTYSLSHDTSSPFINAKGHLGKSIVSSSGVLTFTTGMDNDFYQVDSSNKKAYLYLELKIAKLLNAPVKRTPLNISVVIDRSGSMQGIKMGYAKKAAKAIIDQMEPTDFVSIVMYDNAIDSVQTPILVTDKAMIKSKIDRITPRGATNLWGGTEKGYEFVGKTYKPGFVNRVLLISDGLANAGMTDTLQIRKHVQKYKDENGITISTFGVGLDYNEKLMTDMAETGSGNYYFIDAPDNLVSLFNKELNGMLNVVAQNAVLKIQLPPGVKLEKSFPLKYTQSSNMLTIRLLDLFSEETKGNLFKFGIEDRINTQLKFITSLTYTDVLDGKEKTITNENIVNPIKNVDAYLTHFNKPVLEQTILYVANENLERAMVEADKGNYSDANKLLESNASFFKVNAEYLNNSMELKKMDSSNKRYYVALAAARSQHSDSLKKVQKSGRQDSYRARNKKQ